MLKKKKNLECTCPDPTPDLLNQNSGGKSGPGEFSDIRTVPRDSVVEAHSLRLTTSLSHGLHKPPVGFSRCRQLQNKVGSQWNTVLFKNTSGECSLSPSVSCILSLTQGPRILSRLQTPPKETSQNNTFPPSE